MKLPISLPFQKKENDDYYLSLLVGDEKAHATVFLEKTGKIEVIGEHEQHFPTPIEKLSDDDFINILDKTISNAESKLPEGVQTSKTIFGVKENWIEETKIKKEYLNRLKKVCDALGLTPIGFLVIHEAVAHLLQKEEGAPISTILCEVGTDDIAVSVIRAGKILETKRTPITTAIPQTIDKTLHFFTNYEILPSRIIVFGDKNHPKLSQELTTYQWSKSLPFLHVPQIKILPKKFEARAILFGAATQMGFEVLDKFDMPTIPDEFSSSLPEEVVKASEGDEFGFVTDEDVAKKHITPPSDNFEMTKALPQDDTIESYNQEFFASEHDQHPQSVSKEKPAWQKKIHGVNKKIQHGFASLTSVLPLQKITDTFPSLAHKKGIIFIPPLLIGILLICFLLYIFTLKATATLHINPKTVEKDQEILFSSNQATDFAQNVIGVETVTTTQQGEASTPATGKKEIGEKAKGSLTLYNSTTKEQNVPKGTVITSSNSLQFILDDAVKIASSGGASDGSKTAKGSVVAREIGKEFNLPSGTKFTVGGFASSEVEAKNESAFAGGSKEEITVIAKADTAKLLDTLPKQLQEKANKELKANLSPQEAILPVFLSTGVEKETFDKKVGDEASTVTLNASVAYTSAVYKKTDIESFLLELLAKDDPSLSPSKERLSYTIQDAKEDNGDITATIQIKAFLIPSVEKEKIAKDIAGKSFTDAHATLTRLPGVNDATFSLFPNIPLLPSLLPRLEKNITVEIQTNE